MTGFEPRPLVSEATALPLIHNHFSISFFPYQKGASRSLSFLPNSVNDFLRFVRSNQCDQKKSPNVHKSCPKIISLVKWSILTALQKLFKYVGDFGKLIVAKGFKKLPKVQKIAQSGHTDWRAILAPAVGSRRITVPTYLHLLHWQIVRFLFFFCLPLLWSSSRTLILWKETCN